MRFARSMAAVLFVAACSPAPMDVDSGMPDDDAGVTDDAGTADAGGDAGRPDAGASDAGTDGGTTTTDGGLWPDGTVISVSHARELRGLWVTTVSNLDFPQAAARTRDAGTAELGNIVELAASHGFNTLFFQVRPESDAWYASTREPWSRFITGTQGNNPGYDPLATLITLAHARGLEVHAWLNPFRGLVSPAVNAAPTHITQVLPQHAITYNGAVVMDPSAAAVRSWVASEVGDLTTAYDIDGIHFDDYLYPYPAATPFPDDPQYQAYLTDGGTLSKGDWRRSNINAFVKLTSETIAAAKPAVRFGISPFGIYRPGQPAGITGLDAYEAISCDPLAWMNGGWVDYVAPQLYWPTTQAGQQFGLLIDWWASKAQAAGRYIFAGHALYRLGTSTAWTLAELKQQILLTRAEAPWGAGGIMFRTQHLRDDLEGSKALFKNDVYAAPAIPPPLATQRMATLAAPSVQRTGSTLSLSHAASASIRGYTLYKLVGGGLVLDRFVPGSTATVTVGSGTWAAAAVNRADVESSGVVANVP